MIKKVICEICGILYGIDSQDVIAVDSGRADIALENVPRFTEGAIIFRDEPVPVLSMRLLFKMDMDPILSKIPETEENCIVFMKCGGMKIGFRFDRVVELMDIPDEEIMAIPLIPNAGSTSYIKGVYPYHRISEEELIITVIEPDKLISGDTQKALSEAIGSLDSPEKG